MLCHTNRWILYIDKLSSSEVFGTELPYTSAYKHGRHNTYYNFIQSTKLDIVTLYILFFMSTFFHHVFPYLLKQTNMFIVLYILRLYLDFNEIDIN